MISAASNHLEAVDAASAVTSLVGSAVTMQASANVSQGYNRGNTNNNSDVQTSAKAHDRKELFAIIKEYTTDLGFVFVKLSDISPLQDRLLSTNGISSDLRKKIKTLNGYGHVRFGTFHTY